MISRKYIYSQIEDELIYWVKPQAINNRLAGAYLVHEKVYGKLKQFYPFGLISNRTYNCFMYDKFEPFILSERFMNNITPIKTSPRYLKIQNLIDNRECLHSTNWYRNLLKQLDTTGYANHKLIIMRSKQEIVDFFENYVFSMVNSLCSDGFLSEKAEDIAEIKIGAGGELLHSNSGSHRLYVMQICNISPVPVKINGVHRQWAERAGLNTRRPDPYDLSESIHETMRQYTVAY